MYYVMSLKHRTIRLKLGNSTLLYHVVTSVTRLENHRCLLTLLAWEINFDGYFKETRDAISTYRIIYIYT